MNALMGTSVSVSTRVHVPIQLAWQALCYALSDLELNPGSASLEFAPPGPFESRLSVPVKISTGEGISRYSLKLAIESATRKAVFPQFKGVIALVHTFADTCDLRIEGNYRVPFGGVGKTVDMTLMRNAAKKSLERFANHLGRDIANRVRVVS